jgi:hypothetical protein
MDVIADKTLSFKLQICGYRSIIYLFVATVSFLRDNVVLGLYIHPQISSLMYPHIYFPTIFLDVNRIFLCITANVNLLNFIELQCATVSYFSTKKEKKTIIFN